MRRRGSGICSCRVIAGTDTPSQHAWGNAVDLFPPSKAYGDKVYAWLLSPRVQRALSLNVVCWFGQGGCTTPHNDHIHADFFPHYGGVPPCMGGQQVSRRGNKESPRDFINRICPSCKGSGIFGKDCAKCAAAHGFPITKGCNLGPVPLPQGFCSFFDQISSGHTWVRVGEVVGGGVLTLVGLAGAAIVFGKGLPGPAGQVANAPAAIVRKVRG